MILGFVTFLSDVFRLGKYEGKLATFDIKYYDKDVSSDTAFIAFAATQE